MKDAITKAIEGGYEGLKAIPKYATIHIWLKLKAPYLGIKENVLHLLEVVKRAVGLTQASSFPKNTNTTYATNTIGILSSSDVFSAIQKLKKTLDVSSMANTLGITKEGVHRLIWLLGDVPDIKNGLGIYSSETISLVRNAIQKERILKQTTIQSGLPPLWMKSELQPTSKPLNVGVYGMKAMGGHFVGSVTEVTT